MTRGIIADTYTRRHTISWLALLAALALIAAAGMASTAAATTPSQASPELSQYQAANAGSSSSAEVSTLTNSVGQLGGSAEGQLPLGIGLLAVGLLGLVYGVALLMPRRRAITHAV